MIRLISYCTLSKSFSTNLLFPTANRAFVGAANPYIRVWTTHVAFSESQELRVSVTNADPDTVYVLPLMIEGVVLP